jgi:hypothetical protein
MPSCVRSHQKCEPCSLDCEEDEEGAENEEEVENFTFPAIIPRIREKLFLDKATEVTGSNVTDDNAAQRTTDWAGSRVGKPMSRIGRPRFRRSTLIASSARVLCIEVCAK